MGITTAVWTLLIRILGSLMPQNRIESVAVSHQTQTTELVEMPRLISRKEILQGRDVKWPLSQLQEVNLSKLLDALCSLRNIYGTRMLVSSGYRDPETNRKVGGAANSAHLSCEACDFVDLDRKLSTFCLLNLDVLESLGLYLENPVDTPTWVHLQIRRPFSGNRVFDP